MQGQSVAFILTLWSCFFVLEGRTHSECAPCGRHVLCPDLINLSDCERVRRPCGCCDECARQMGEYCSAASPRDLDCWNQLHYGGSLQNIAAKDMTAEEIQNHYFVPNTSDKNRCAKGLMCMNSRGETLERVPWIMKKYHGICQNVVVQPVVEENYNVDDRRIGSRHEKNRV